MENGEAGSDTTRSHTILSLPLTTLLARVAALLVATLLSGVCK